MKKYPIGVQLYSFRKALKADFKGTMKEIAALGYDGVEFALYFGDMEPLELADFMKSLGLKTYALHVGLNHGTDPNLADYAYAKALGAKTVICSGDPERIKDVDTLMADVRKVKAAAAANGLNFAYHNHAFEFYKLPDGSFAYDKLVGELDVYGLSKGGVDPTEYIRRYRRRLPLLHLKDHDPKTDSFTELGTGDIPLKACVEALEGSPCEYLIYEQDSCNYPGVESAKISIENLKKILGY